MLAYCVMGLMKLKKIFVEYVFRKQEGCQKILLEKFMKKKLMSLKMEKI